MVFALVPATMVSVFVTAAVTMMMVVVMSVMMVMMMMLIITVMFVLSGLVPTATARLVFPRRLAAPVSLFTTSPVLIIP